MGDASAIKEAPFPLTDVDRWVLSQTDEEFKLQSWEDLKVVIGKWESGPKPPLP